MLLFTGFVLSVFAIMATGLVIRECLNRCRSSSSKKDLLEMTTATKYKTFSTSEEIEHGQNECRSCVVTRNFV